MWTVWRVHKRGVILLQWGKHPPTELDELFEFFETEVDPLPALFWKSSGRSLTKSYAKNGQNLPEFPNFLAFFPEMFMPHIAKRNARTILGSFGQTQKFIRICGSCLESALNNCLPFLKIYFHFLSPRLTWFPLCTPSETWSISSIWLHHDHSRPSSWNQVICFKLRDDCQYLPLFVGRSIFRLMQMLCLFINNF